MNLRIDAIKLNDVIEALENEIKDLTNAYNDIENKMKVLDGTNSTWQSASQKTTYEYYETIQEDFSKSVENIKNLKDFLKQTLDNYMESVKSSQKNIDDNEDSIDIN